MGYKLIDLSQEIYTGARCGPVIPRPRSQSWIPTKIHASIGRFTEDYGYTAEKIEMSTHGHNPRGLDQPHRPHPRMRPPSKSSPGLVLHQGHLHRPVAHAAQDRVHVEDIKAALDKYGLEIRKGRHGAALLGPLYPDLWHRCLADTNIRGSAARLPSSSMVQVRSTSARTHPATTVPAPRATPLTRFAGRCRR